MGFLSQTEVIERFQNAHEKAHDYSFVDYKGSHIKVNILCLSHQERFQIKAYHFWNGHTGCAECIKEARELTNLERYGVSNCYQSVEKQQKIKDTNIERYGVEHVMHSQLIKIVLNPRRLKDMV